MNCVADDRHRRPLADRGSPGRTHGNAVTNPRIRVCSTVVLTALPPPLRTRFSLPQPVPDNGIAHPRPTSLTTNIRVSARELVVEPRVRLLPQHRRSLLRRLEPPHRPALAHHVHRPPGLGQCMMTSAGWYKAQRGVRGRFGFGSVYARTWLMRSGERCSGRPQQSRALPKPASAARIPLGRTALPLRRPP